MRRITKLGGVIVGIGAGAAALVWLVKDRLLGPESVPVEASEAPEFRVAPGPPSVAPPDADDLSKVVGIGPVYRARLEQAGLTSFAALAAASTEAVAAAAQVPVERATDWCSQAAALVG